MLQKTRVATGDRLAKSLAARRLSEEMRHDRSPEMRRRRWIVGLSLLGVAMGQAVSLYQTGIVRKLPDLKVGPFDANRVDKAPYAYSRAETPDALLMIVSYGITGVLAGMAGSDRARRRPWIPLALFAKTAYDSFIAAKLGTEEWRDERKLCLYCQVATLASFASLCLAAVDAFAAGRRVSEQGRDAWPPVREAAGKRVRKVRDKGAEIAGMVRHVAKKGGRALPEGMRPA